MPQIELEHLTKKFGDFIAVDDLTLTIDDGAFVTLLGPSGCGKTTTLRQIAGLETPTSGKITIDGKTVFSSKESIDISPSKRGVGFLFQNYALWPHMTVWQNIAFGLENLKWPKEKVKERVEELLHLLKIEEFPKRYPAELSGGQQQRVAIARTLGPNPRILLMDEPLSNLDAKLRMEMRTELKRLHHETGATFVYVTHDQLEAMTLATKICLLDNGLLQQYDPPLTVYERPKNTFVADFVGNPSINLLEFEAKEVDESSALLKGHGFELLFKGATPFAATDTMTLGIRPENVKITDGDGIRVTVNSSLPSGMETTLRLLLADGDDISSVVFGSVDFSVNSTLSVSIVSDMLNLFNDKGELVSMGSVELKGQEKLS